MKFYRPSATVESAIEESLCLSSQSYRFIYMPLKGHSIDGVSRPENINRQNIYRQPMAVTKKNLSKVSKKLKIELSLRALLISLIVMVLLLSLTSWRLFFYEPQSPIPAEISSRVDYALFYPASLPAGHRIDEHSFSGTKSAVIFSISDLSNNKIIFSEQKVDPSLDLTELYSDKFIKPEVVSTPYGLATMGLAEGKLVASLAAGETWIIATANSQTNLNILKELFRSIRKN